MIGIEGPVVRLDFVARELVKLSRQYKIKRVHYDRYYVADLKIALKDVGGSDIELVETAARATRTSRLASPISSRLR